MRCAITNIDAVQVQMVGGGHITHTRAGNITFADLDLKQKAALEAQGAQITQVGKVSPDTDVQVEPPVPVTAIPSYTSGQVATLMGIEALRAITDPPTYGTNVNVAVIDTGIRPTHEHILGRVMYTHSFVGTPGSDEFDHGTGIASIIVTCMPAVNLLDMKVIGSSGAGTEEDVVMAIDECIGMLDDSHEYAPHIINLSIGTPDDGNPYNPLRVICREAITRDIWVVAAAGNGGPGTGTVTCPACEEFVAAIGCASIEPIAVSSFSSRGPTLEGITKPELVMFGENILVASSNSDIAEEPKTGTSFSTPFCTGIAAGYLEAATRGASHSIPNIGTDPVFRVSWPIAEREYLPYLCYQPEGYAAQQKNNASGYGLLLGTLVADAFESGVSGSLTALIVPMMMIGMMGMVMKSVSGNGRK